MTVIQGIILGIVQGLTEFLPVSSSGHLVVVGELLNTNMEGDPGFVIIAHAGSLLAVLLFFRHRIMKIISDILRWDKSGIQWLILLIVSTIPAAIIGLTFQDSVETIFYNSTAVGIAWLGTAFLLWIGQRFSTSRFTVENMGISRALYIGLAQAFALLPGISRSGSTLSIGMLLGVKRRELLDFIFIMSIPPIAGGTLLESLKWSSGTSPFTIAHVWGGIAAAISGYFAIAVMLKVVNAGKMGWFALYCAVVGIIALVVTVA
jgi:undecaprenyl-diphosphatase